MTFWCPNGCLIAQKGSNDEGISLCGLNVQSLNGKVINVMHIFFFYVMHMLWLNFFLGLNVIFLCLKLIIIHYHTPKQRKIKFKPRKNWTTTHFCHCFSGNSGGSWMTVHSPSINTSSPLQIRQFWCCFQSKQFCSLGC